ncbi:hypothetical protein [Rhodococcus sp. JT-3]|uniref:hypothetical protein n=1 Tax=Rhodococcus sp. JT-3 TaxID=1973213 RepID=UPI00130325F5|nr:hypothetical protein [Rhodococcus sp. JT-3]
MVPMLRQNVIVHEISLSSGTPWHVYIAAVIAGVTAIGGWIVVHRTSQSRDLKNWRRTTLLEAVSTIVETSISRRDHIQASIGNYDRFTIKQGYEVPSEVRESQRKMLAARYQVQICKANDVLIFAEEIIKLHARSSDAIQRLQRSYVETPYEIVRNMTDEQIRNNEALAEIDIIRFDHNHREIIRALQVELNLSKDKPFTGDLRILHKHLRPAGFNNKPLG